jgi:hypothetical protein
MKQFGMQLTVALIAFEIFATSANASTLLVNTSSDVTVYASTTNGPIDSALASNDVYIRVFGEG